MSTLVPAAIGCVTISLFSLNDRQNRRLFLCSVIAVTSLYVQMVNPKVAYFPLATIGSCVILVLKDWPKFPMFECLYGVTLSVISATILNVFPYQWWRLLPLEPCLILIWCLIPLIWVGPLSEKTYVIAVAGTAWPIIWLCSGGGLVSVGQSDQLVPWLDCVWFSLGMSTCVHAGEALSRQVFFHGKQEPGATSRER